MFAMNINDASNALTGAQNLAAIQPNFDICYNAYRAVWPTTPLFVLGVTASSPAGAPNILAYEKLLAAYVAEQRAKQAKQEMEIDTAIRFLNEQYDRHGGIGEEFSPF